MCGRPTYTIAQLTGVSTVVGGNPSSARAKAALLCDSRQVVKTERTYVIEPELEAHAGRELSKGLQGFLSLSQRLEISVSARNLDGHSAPSKGWQARFRLVSRLLAPGAYNWEGDTAWDHARQLDIEALAPTERCLLDSGRSLTSTGARKSSMDYAWSVDQALTKSLTSLSQLT